ncbi:MAG: MBOAT family protein [Candidatus Cloacimonadaceae bacterium]
MFINLYYFPFLIVTAVIYWLLPKRWVRTAFLTVCSLGFIGYFDQKAVYVVIGLTLFTYFIAYWMEKGRHTGLAHTIGVLGLLAVLIIFKYLGFLTGTINSLLSFFHALPVFHFEELALPLGISYITFKYISYLTDIRWKIVSGGKLLDFACYGSLFTIFVAGPIERFERLKPQLEAKAEKFKPEYLEIAFQRIVYGLAKKLILADWLGYFITPVWQNPTNYSALIRIAALFGYSFQIYFDFAGYSDIAIGSSRLFGLKIMENFNKPYLAPNISQFWRRWHISLSDWIRDYLFFPLSQGKTNQFWLIFCVPVISMGLCGLWHGAAWHYVIWGIWHGVGISILQCWNLFKRAHKKKIAFVSKPWFKYCSTALTFVYVTAGWWWFR